MFKIKELDKDGRNKESQKINNQIEEAFSTFAKGLEDVGMFNLTILLIQAAQPTQTQKAGEPWMLLIAYPTSTICILALSVTRYRICPPAKWQ